jgi:hypothetical protein
MMINRETPIELGENPSPVPLRPPRILHEVTQDSTRDFTVRSLRLATWDMTQPSTKAVIHN